MQNILFTSIWVFLTTALLSSTSLAYNSGGFPFAKIHSEKAHLIVSDKKSILNINGKYIKIPIIQKPSSNRASGGINIIGSEINYLACLGNDVFIYNSSNDRLLKKELRSKNILCAINENSEHFFYLKDKNEFFFNNRTIKTSHRFLLWKSFKNSFLGLSEDGYIYKFKNGKLAKFVDKKIYNVDSYSNFEVARSTAIVTTSYGIFQFNLAENNPDKMMRLPISPCADKQVCGVSIGDDGSVLISGYWGTWLGRDQDFKRIKMPQISRENGGTAISHTKEDGTYLIVSYDDADLGSLPNISPSLLSPANSLSSEKTSFTPKADALVVWSKVKLVNASPLFHININGNKTFIYQVNHLDENSISKFLYYEKNSYLQLVKDAAKKDFLFTTNTVSPWWHEGIGLKKSRLKSESLPNKQIKIGIVDSGINYNHLEFSHLSDDQITSYDFVDEDEIANDVHGHGSHVSGIIAGKNYGIFPSANLVIAKALDKKGQSNSIDLARAVVWTIDQKPDLINFSWGGGFQTQVLRDAVEYGKSKGVLMLSSAGNSGSDIDKHPEIPISYGGVVAISSFTKDSKLAKHSSYGQNNVSFAFPGEDILSAHLGTTSKEMSGTSMAVAAASASFAFLSSLELPNLGFLKPQEIHNRLCKPISGYWSKYTRCGQFNLELALKELYK